jgi:hypothetical protein
VNQRPKWSNGDYAAAMVRYVAAHAKHPEKMRDGGIQSEAFHRGGDNPSSLRVWPGSSQLSWMFCAPAASISLACVGSLVF